MEYEKDQEIEELQVEDSYNEEELQGVLKSEMDDAKDFIDQIDEDRADATDYYLGNAPTAQSSM